MLRVQFWKYWVQNQGPEVLQRFYLRFFVISSFRVSSESKVQARQERADAVRLRPLTSTGCCFWISSWWGRCLRARWWCHRDAFSAPKQDVPHKLELTHLSFHLPPGLLLYLSFLLALNDNVPAGFRLQGWGPGRRQRTDPEAPQTSLLAGPARCHTESSLVGIWVLWKKEEEDEEQISMLLTSLAGFEATRKDTLSQQLA